MRVVIAALISASFLFCTSAAVKKQRKTTPDGPVVTIGYLLYEPKVKNVTWEFQFNSSLHQIHKHAEAWLRFYINLRFKLQTWKIMQVDETMKSKLDSLERNDTLVDPYEALDCVKDNEKRITNPPNILCLVTEKPLTVYSDGFGLYYRLCKDVVPLILTYNQTSDKATGQKLGFLIQGTMNITNLFTWHQKSPEEKKQHFKNCQSQRELKQKL
uniref:Putative secreted protein n=1 Tax=Ixodes ricinus TaxID=34613 RepID=A0A0K8RKV7_IXORI